MTKRLSELDPLLGWSRTGVAQQKRKVQRDRIASRTINLPERKNTLELGDELIAVRRGTETVRMTADDLMLDQLIARCLGGKRHRDFDELYTLVNAEEEAEVLRSTELSHYQRKKLLAAIKVRLGYYAMISARLLRAGIAEIGRDGVMRPARRSF